MPSDSLDPALLLFVPANRPERYAKAAGAGADAIIIDLEDAVAPPEKDGARLLLETELSHHKPPGLVYVRINATATAWHGSDVEVVSKLNVDGVLLPKTESAADIAALRALVPPTMRIIAIVETVRGLAALEDIASAADRLVFGSLDFATDLGCAHQRDALLLARSRIVLAARLAGRPAPVDGVTLSIKDEGAIEDDARYGASLGFAGKLLIHPAQVAPARRGMAPAEADFIWASKVVLEATDGTARAVGGTMVDAPVLARARQIVAAHQRFSNGH